MNIRPVTQWTFYRYRFVLSYLVLAIAVILLLTININSLPPGLGPNEQQSVIASHNVPFDALPTSVIDLPYHALQKLSLDYLGMNPLGVRLPSLVFACLTALFLVLILRRWFLPSIALIAAFVLLTSGWFLDVGRLGAPFIMVPFLTSLLILCATYVSQQTKAWEWWRVLFALAAALSFYTPLMVYLFVAAIVAAFAQPHLRYLLRESGKLGATAGTFLFIGLLVPLGWGIYKEPGSAWTLLGLPTQLPDPLQFGNSLLQAASNFINPFNMQFGELLTPAMGIATAVLLVFGGIQLFRDFHSVRAHVLLIWAGLMVPIVAFNPSNLTVLLVPSLLVVAIGINMIIRYWYKLFPRNPYARIFGFIPIAVLLVTLVQFNYQRYIYGMLYNPQAGQVFQTDAFLAGQKLNSLPQGSPATLIVSEKEVPLYKIVAKNHPDTKVISAEQATDQTGTWLVAETEVKRLPERPENPPTSLLVNDRATSALRFRVYER